jgi:hypothetical protein
MKTSGWAPALILAFTAFLISGCVEDTQQPQVRDGDPSDIALLEGLSFKLVPDFSLNDMNANSPTYSTEVSPRELEGKVSAYYFGSAT